jgi:hypothetical protein
MEWLMDCSGRLLLGVVACGVLQGKENCIWFWLVPCQDGMNSRISICCYLCHHFLFFVVRNGCWVSSDCPAGMCNSVQSCASALFCLIGVLWCGGLTGLNFSLFNRFEQTPLAKLV